MTGTVVTSAPAAARSLRVLLILLCGALALVVAGNSALAIALPDVATDLGADQIELTWIIDGYALTFAALLLPAGIAADRVGRRTFLVVGLGVFAAANVASAFALDPAWLIGLRALAGAGAAAVFPVTLSALVDAYPPHRRGFAVAVWSGVSAAGAVLGTIVAGALLEVAWWGSIQLVFGVVAAALIPGVAMLVAQRRNPALSLDPLGAVLSVVSLTALVYGVIEAPRLGWGSPATIAAFVVAAGALAAFIGHELRTAHPSLDVRAFRQPALAGGALLVFLQFFASLALFVLAPQYLQLVRDHTPLQAALSLLVIPVGVGAGTALAPVLLDRVGPRPPAAGGLAAMALGLAGLAATLAGVLRDPAPLWALGLGLVVFGFGFGLAITPGTVLIIDGLPPERRSVASAVNDLTREVGGVLGIAVLSSILISRYRVDIAPALVGLPDVVSRAAGEGAGAGLAAAGLAGPDASALAEATRQAFTGGLSSALWVAAAVLAAATVVVWVLAPRGAGPTGRAVPTGSGTGEDGHGPGGHGE